MEEQDQKKDEKGETSSEKSSEKKAFKAVLLRIIEQTGNLLSILTL